MRTLALVKLLSAETGVPDYSDPRCTVWRNAENRVHRDFGPAIAHSDGSRCWFRNGLLHREDGPAIVWPDGTQKWYRNGLLHREDGPAVVQADGTRKWLVNGELIR